MGIFTRAGYNKKYCILHPRKVVMHKCRDIKCAWQRATNGYCFRDVWAIDEWFVNVFPEMIEELIEIHHSYFLFYFAQIHQQRHQILFTFSLKA